MGAIDFRQIVIRSFAGGSLHDRCRYCRKSIAETRHSPSSSRWSFGRSLPEMLRSEAEPNGWTMPASTMSVFSNACDLEEALRNVGDVHLIVTGRGEFLARLTQVELQRLRLWAVHEHVSRIDFLKDPTGHGAGAVHHRRSAVADLEWNRLNKGEILTCGPSHRLHMRTEGPSHWGAVSLPADEFRAYFDRLTGQVLPCLILAQRWRPSAADCRRFVRLHAAAICAAGRRPQTIVDPEAAHGMEQQLIHSLVGCLSAGPGEEASGPDRCQDVVADLEDLLRRQPGRYADLAALRTELAVPEGLYGVAARRSWASVLPLTLVYILRTEPVVLSKVEGPGNCHAIVTGLSLERLAGSQTPSEPPSCLQVLSGVFADPDEHAAAIRQGVSEMTVTGRGAFRSEIVRIDFRHLWMQRFSEREHEPDQAYDRSWRPCRHRVPDAARTSTVLARRGTNAGEPHTPQGRGRLLSPFGRAFGYRRDVAAAG